MAKFPAGNLAKAQAFYEEAPRLSSNGLRCKRPNRVPESAVDVGLLQGQADAEVVAPPEEARCAPPPQLIAATEFTSLSGDDDAGSRRSPPLRNAARTEAADGGL